MADGAFSAVTKNALVAEQPRSRDGTYSAVDVKETGQ